MSDPWTEAEREQLARWATLSYAQRLEWLWQAKLFAQRALGAARPRVPAATEAGSEEASPSDDAAATSEI